MNNYEHLLSQDPIGAFDEIKEHYLRYFETAYKIADKELDKERVDLLEKNGNLYKSPYIELLPEYNSYHGINDVTELAPKFKDAFGSAEDSMQFFKEFIKVGLMSYVPYVHQVDMLKKVFCQDPNRFNNAVVTTGTGSGKTESFLFPLFAQLFKEAKTWKKVNNDKDWYAKFKTVYDPCQRDGQDDAHEPALRALIMYPMNALVEDQMARLRKALDSDEIRKFMDSDDGLKGNRIYYGSYNGSTIGMKNYDLIKKYGPDKALEKARRRLRKDLGKIHERYDNICKYYQTFCDKVTQAEKDLEVAKQNGKKEEILKAQIALDEAKQEKAKKEDVLYTAPRLGGDKATAEMITRWDMQNWAPDIMITNVSMLSIMLMRKAEENIFIQTRRWLNGDPDKMHPTRIFHIVLDELHLYRDTAGSETACLIRMLLNAIGLPPVVDDGNGHKIPNPQLRVLASSASLGDEKATQKFLEEFFGVYNTASKVEAFNVIPKNREESDYIPQRGADVVDYEKFAVLTNDFVLLDNDAKVREMDKLAKSLGCDDAVSFIHKYERTIFADFVDIIKKVGGGKTGICIDDLVFQKEGKPYLFKTKETLRGFLIFRGYADRLLENGKPLKHRLPRIRFHQFFKYIEGMWGELRPTVDDHHVSPVQSLSYLPQEVGPHNGKVLELLRCECCGELFIGGNRKTQEGKTFMTLNYPSLDKIPNFNPTPMVQNKSFEDYALFWPTHEKGVNLPQDYDHLSSQNSNETAYTKLNAKAEWEQCYLDIYTGEIKEYNEGNKENSIEGFLLKAEKNDAKKDQHLSYIHALPCCCPRCFQNYTSRKYAKSPIRSFRTGIDRSNQLLSKELMYQLNDNSAKLIGFSDSRQDAAKQALGIETEHYRDMVRMLFIESLNDISKEDADLVTYIRNEKNKETNIADVINSCKEKYQNSQITEIAIAVYYNEADLQKLINDTISIKRLIGSDGILLKKLVKLGINPAGPEYKYQSFKETGVDAIYHWNRAFDFKTGELRSDLKFDSYGLDKDTIEMSLSSAVFANSFGKYMGLSTLDAGIGYICCPNNKQVRDSSTFKKLDNFLKQYNANTLDFVDSFIRILGDNHRYKDPESDLKSWTPEELGKKKLITKPIDAFSKANDLNDNEKKSLITYLCEFLREFVSGEASCLQFEKLAFKKFTPQSMYYECPKCHRVHPNKGFGGCTNLNCSGELKEENKKNIQNLHGHFISHDILIEPREPRRLHTEELTGQTDNIQERLLNFKDMVLLDSAEEKFRKGYETTVPIDMVNVTTTMEVGVDIGSLEAIFQGNMPPTRYNYQQRVGRGGRRGQAFSTAVTFCRGRSHDVYYYKNATDEIVGGMPAPPELSLAPYKEIKDDQVVYHMKQAIMKRVIVKELLHIAYEDLPYDYDLKDNCGEFGRVFDWKSGATKDILDKWIKSQEGAEEIERVVNYYFSQFNTSDQDITDDIDQINEWINKKLVSSIEKSLTKEMDLNKGLAQCLSELGYLPMYGMPSDVRNFYHGLNRRNDEVMSIDRPSEMALSEFAPGSEKTKDKGVYRIEALTLPMDFREDKNGNEELKFYFKDDDPDEEKDALKDRYIITYDQKIDQSNRDANIIKIDPVKDLSKSAKTESSGLGENQRLIVIPRAFRSNTIWNNNGTPAENSDRSSSFTQCQIFAKDDVTNANIKKIVNVKLSTYGLNLNNDSEVWHVNSNNNRFYRGKYASYLYPNGGGDSSLDSNFTFYTLNNKDKKMYPIDVKDKESFELALGSRKPTEMISLELQKCPDVLSLDITKDDCNKSAVRAALFSAAFLLQRTLADELDVQPDEIEISEKIVIDKKYPIIYLNDALPNGAGIVSHLAKDGKLEEMIKKIINFETDFMKSLIKEEHRKVCKTACQDCLLTYNNRGYHHIIDWRMGVGILRLMIQPGFDFGFAEINRSNYKELEDYADLIIAAAEKKNVKLNAGEYYVTLTNNSTKPGQKKNKLMIFYHPLWNKSKVLEMVPGSDSTNVELYNIFNLLRSNIVNDKLPQSGSAIKTIDNQKDSDKKQSKSQTQEKDKNTTKPKMREKSKESNDGGIKPNMPLGKK